MGWPYTWPHMASHGLSWRLRKCGPLCGRSAHVLDDNAAHALACHTQVQTVLPVQAVMVAQGTAGR